MQKHERTGKRLLALVLALVMALSTVTECLAAVVERPVTAGGKETVTAGELVAKAYDSELTDAEKALLNAGLLLGDQTISYTAPSDSSKVAVDGDKRTIRAASITEGGYTWTPVAAAVVYDNGTGASAREDVTLTNGEGSFTYAGNTYSVQVTYSAGITIAEAEQRDLLQQPYLMAQALQNMDTIQSKVNRFDQTRSYVDYLVTIAEAQETDGSYVFSEAARQAAADLKTQSQKPANNGAFDLVTLVNAYKSASSKLQYLLNTTTRQSLLDTLDAYYTIIEALGANKAGSLQYDLAAYTADGTQLPGVDATTNLIAGMVPNVLVGLYEDMQAIQNAIADDNWGLFGLYTETPSLTAEQFAQLDTLADAAKGSSNSHAAMALQEQVRTLSTTITANVNRQDLTVKVVAYIIPTGQKDNATLATMDSNAVVLHLTSGMALADVEKAIADAGIETTALTDWANGMYPDINTTNYDRTTTNTVGAKLDADAEYTITYTAKDYTLNTGDGDKTVPYGYNVTLPPYSSEEQSYQYTLNGTVYEQNEVYRVVGDAVFTRTLDKTKTTLTYGALVADAAAGQMDAMAQALLKSGALKLNGETIRVRVPGAGDDIVKVAAAGGGSYTVKAAAYAARYEANGAALFWLPGTVTFVGGTLDGQQEQLTLGADGYEVTVNGTFDSVQVAYQLDLNGNVDGLDVLEAMNLPDALVTDAASHKAAMQKLVDKTAALSEVDINVLNTLISYRPAAGGTPLEQETVDALAYVRDNCIDNNTNKLLLLTYINAYSAAQPNGLAYFYGNDQYKTIRSEVATLYQYLDQATNTEAKRNAISAVEVGGKHGADYIAKLDNVIALLQGLLSSGTGSLPASINAQIDTSVSLTDFAALLTAAAGKTASYTAAADLSRTVVMTAAAPDKVQATVTVSAEGMEKSGSKTYSMGYTLTDTDVAELNALADSLWAQLQSEPSAVAANLSADFYEKTSDVPGFTAGQTMDSNAQTVVTYAAKSFTVKIDGEADQTITVKNAKVVLPAPAAGSNRYDYAIGSQTVPVQGSDGAYTFSAQEIKALFVGGVYTIARTTVNVADKNVKDFITGANSKVGNTSINFLPVEDNGEVTGIVLRLGLGTDFTTSAVTKLGEYILRNSGVSSITLGGRNEFYKTEAGVGSKAYLSALLNEVLNSGLTLADVLAMINADGSLNEMAMPAEGTVAASYGLLGAKVLKTTVKMNVNGTETADLPLYVTVEDFGQRTSQLVKAREALMTLTNRVTAEAANGTVTAKGTMPEKYWSLALAAMIAVGETDLDSYTSLTTTDIVNYLYDELGSALYHDADVDLVTVGNTLLKLGVSQTNVDKLTGKNGWYAKFKALGVTRQTATGGTGAGNGSYGATLSVSVEKLLEVLVKDESTRNTLSGFVAMETLSVPFNVTLKNTGEAYAAVMMNTSGVKFLKSLPATLDTNNTVLMLLSDVSGSLNITGRNVVVDLHGKTLTGSITGAAGNVNRSYVVDSSLNSAGTGTVTGTVSNMVLAGGTYTGNTDSSVVRDGYTKDANGLVTNDYYTIEEGANGAINVTLKATAQSLRDADKYTVAALAADLASDLLLNYYSTAQKVTVDGHTLYNAAVEDITTLFQNGKFHVSNAVGNNLLDDILGYTREGAADNYDGVNYLIGSILDALLDFQNLADSIGSGNAAVSYSLTATAWDVTVDKAESGDYLAIGVTGSTDSSKTKRQTLNVFLNSDSAKNNEQLKNALEQLAGIIEVDTADKPSLSLDRITLPQELGGKTVQAKLSGSGHVTVKISDKPVYAALMAITVANSLPASDSLRAELKNAVETFYDNNDAAALKTAMEKVTCAQVFAALKTVGLRTNFLQMAISVGFGTGSKTYKAISENYDSLTAYRGGMAAAGWLLKQLNINGNGATLAGFETEFGIYKYAPDKTFNKTATVSGDWKVNGVVSLENAKLTLELFAEEGAIVVIDKDGKHTSFAADQLTAAVAKVNEAGGTLRFNDAVTMAADETITKDVVVVNGSKLDQGSYVFLLDGVNSKLTSDAALTVKSSDGAFRLVTDNTTAGKYIYTLEAYKIRYVKDGNAAYDDSLAVAVTNADEGTTITVLEDVTARGEIEVSKSLTIAGAGKITGDPTFKLTGAAGTVLTADAALTVISGDETAYYVNAVSDGAEYTYTLTAWEVVLEKADGSKTGYHDLASAMTDAVDGDTITVNSSVKMTGDISINSAKTLTIKGAGLIDQNGYAFILGDKDAKLVADSSSLTVKTTVAGDYELNKVTQNGMTTYKLTAWEIMLVKADGSKTGYHDLAAAAADAKTGDTVNVNSSVKMTGNIAINSAKTLTIKGAGLIDQNGHAFELGHKDAKLVADSDSLFVKVTVAGGYEVSKVTQGEMTAYIVKVKSSDDDDDHGGGGGGGGYIGNYIYLDVQPSGINAKQLQTAVRKYFGDSSAEVTVNSGLTASGLVANGASIYVSGSRAGSYTVIIMGDTNCNGKTDSGDAVKMRNHYFGTAQLTGAALEAADMNRNGKVDSGDAVKNRVKYQNWGGYSSTLKITV